MRLYGHLAARCAALSIGIFGAASAQTAPAAAGAKPPNILIIWGDDVGIANLTCS